MATSSFAHYSASNVTFVFGGIIADGLADGESINVSFTEDAFTLTTGIDGKSVRNKILNRSATITLTLLASSATNTALSTVYNLDQLASNGAGVAPFVLRDGNGTTVLSAPYCWIARPPDVSVDEEVASREWTLHATPLEYIVNGY